MFSLPSLSLLLPAISTLASGLAIPHNTSSFQIQWKNVTTNLDFGTLHVPIDWDNRHGETVQLGMYRHKALKPDQKVGTLMFNPGGPGYNASVYVQYAQYAFGPDAYNYFDIVGLDTRGVGASSPIKCDPEIYNERVSMWPSTQSELDALVGQYQRLGESCLEMSGSLVAHMDSISVAKDMEAIRLALNDGKLNYLGLSYGTLYGSTYAELFPHNIRSMVLDGNMDHSQDEISYLTVNGDTMETGLTRFSEWCAQNSTCALHKTDVLTVFDDLVKHANEHPIPAPGCKASGTCRSDVTGQELQSNIGNLLWFKTAVGLETSWADLAGALYLATQGNATALSSSLATSPSSDVYQSTAIHCLDWTHPPNSLSEIKYREELSNGTTPHIGGAGSSRNECIGWPIAQKYHERRVHIRGTPQILQTNALHDPSTSYVGASNMHTQIQNSVLLTRRGDGHTSYFQFGETSRAIDAYLVHLTVPEPNTVLDS
ncbi:hypothetical protein FE257_008601 [Aspergillus nanangensis]|uniref:AB hydrolase-1 domain-containing protein n=1 Tax=Aspergillus nanangensis TaxID=2582783 RepID=A0AAD4GSH8_ASPNN|nr:hypothetical protein FE257_008601 [Aspergillus nanangensis]